MEMVLLAGFPTGGPRGSWRADSGSTAMRPVPLVVKIPGCQLRRELSGLTVE